jgi:Tfp pilus assembly protein PilF
MHLPTAARASAAAAFIGAALLYALTLCPTVHVAGTGENATAATTLGVPHPPGFPLFCLLGRLAVVVLPGPPARAVNLFAAACGAGAAALVAWMVAGLAGGRVSGGFGGGLAALAGFGAGILFAAAAGFWSQATIAEVYSLSALLLAIELALLLAWRGDVGADRPGRARRERWLLAFGFAFGVGVSVHPLHALMLPGYAVLILSSRRPRLAELGASAALAVLGFSLHLYTPLRSALDPVLDWGDPESKQAFVRYLTAAQYRGRMFSLTAAEVGVNLARLGKLLLAQWSPPLLVLPVAGAAILAARRRGLAAGLGLMAAANIIFALNYDIPWEIEVYYIPLILLLALASGVALLAVAERSRIVGVAAVAVAVVVPVALNFASANHRHGDLVERYGRDILDALPADAVLITPPVNPTFVLLYLTAAEGARPDVRIVVATEGGLAPLGDALRPGRMAVTPWSLAADLDRHSVFYAERDPLDDLPGFRLEPVGPIYRLVRDTGERAVTSPPPELRVDPLRDVRREDDFHLRLIAARYLIAAADQAWAAGDTAGALAHLESARGVGGDLAAVLAAIASSLASAGRRSEAIVAYEQALELKKDASITNRLGRLRLEAGDLAGAEAAFREAIALDDHLAIAHSNLGALLGQRGEYPGAVAALDRAVALDPLSIKAYNNLGTALLLAGDPRRSAAAFRRSLALNPDQPSITVLLKRAEATPPPSVPPAAQPPQLLMPQVTPPPRTH